MDHTILVMAQDAPQLPGAAAGRKKGDPIAVRPAGHVWGRKEGLPQFVHIDVPDSDRGVLDDLLQALTPEKGQSRFHFPDVIVDAARSKGRATLPQQSVLDRIKDRKPV